MTAKEFAQILVLQHGFKGNSMINLGNPEEVRYRYYDEEYECPSTRIDEAYGIELLGTDDFELQLSAGVVHSSDLTDEEIGRFYLAVIKNNRMYI